MIDTAWDYGGAHRKYDMNGPIALPNGSMVQVCDWQVEMPEFMRRADTLFIDPPWNMGNVRSFYTKADLPRADGDFTSFSHRLLGRIDEIGPKTIFVEMGKEFLGLWLTELGRRFKYITFYNSTYYKKRANKCYVIHATGVHSGRRHAELEDLDEAEIIAWVCKNHPYNVIGDLCMGRGLVGLGAYRAGKPFVGTELNPKRLACLVDAIQQAEGGGDVGRRE